MLNGESWADFSTRIELPATEEHKELVRLSRQRLQGFPEATIAAVVAATLSELARDAEFRRSKNSRRRVLARDSVQRACFTLFTAPGTALHEEGVVEARRKLVGYSREASAAVEDARKTLRRGQRITEVDSPWRYTFHAEVGRACVERMAAKLAAGDKAYVSRTQEIERIGPGCQENMFRAALGITRDREMAEEATSEQWGVLAKNYDFPLGLADPVAYACECVRNRARRMLRDRRQLHWLPKRPFLPQELPRPHSDLAADLQKRDPHAYQAWCLKDCQQVKSYLAVARQLSLLPAGTDHERAEEARKLVAKARSYVRVTAPGSKKPAVFRLSESEDEGLPPLALAAPRDSRVEIAEATSRRDEPPRAVLDFLVERFEAERQEPPKKPKHFTALLVQYLYLRGDLDVEKGKLIETIQASILKVYGRQIARGTVGTWLYRAQQELRDHLRMRGSSDDDIHDVVGAQQDV
jgi:hypothetical protein